MSKSEELKKALVEMMEPEALAFVRERADEGEDPREIIGDLREGIQEVGNRFEDGEFFLTELIMAGRIFKEALEILSPKLTGSAEEPKGTVVIGTIQGDIHDIGKNIVATLLSASGFEVHDLGVDVPPELFLEKVKEVQADILGISTLLTVSYEQMKEAISRVKKEFPNTEVKVIVGGGPIDEMVRRFVGADTIGVDAAKAVDICQQFITRREG
tara:strand:+ start:279 stop:920 length:642 start_codon:yes stop_codon:yes gene_type:complete